jgi:hypothetical protein
MKEPFIEWLEREAAFKTQMDFDYWLENLDTSEVIEKADEWMRVTREGLQEWFEREEIGGYNRTREIIEFINRK